MSDEQFNQGGFIPGGPTRVQLGEGEEIIGKDPAWCWPHQIEPWARETGRLKA